MTTIEVDVLGALPNGRVRSEFDLVPIGIDDDDRLRSAIRALANDGVAYSVDDLVEVGNRESDPCTRRGRRSCGVELENGATDRRGEMSWAGAVLLFGEMETEAFVERPTAFEVGDTKHDQRQHVGLCVAVVHRVIVEPVPRMGGGSDGLRGDLDVEQDAGCPEPVRVKFGEQCGAVEERCVDQLHVGAVGDRDPIRLAGGQVFVF